MGSDLQFFVLVSLLTFIPYIFIYRFAPYKKGLSIIYLVIQARFIRTGAIMLGLSPSNK
ncbi:uncharacterized protein RJT21DRAFT_33353 [Scheffersomyces amazonensis]|uniref:uncharacterized protein n=1 Tax=Scheffersomyces amazonensis TaxID=1078765 RepID=UPI00315D7855